MRFEMPKSTVREKAQALLTLTQQLVQMRGLTWVDANNTIYSPGGPFARLFPTKAERVAFGKTKESQQIDNLICSLPEPPVRPGPPEDWTKFMIPVRKSAKSRPRQRVSSASR
jgi:hypothetical protein